MSSISNNNDNTKNQISEEFDETKNLNETETSSFKEIKCEINHSNNNFQGMNQPIPFQIPYKGDGSHHCNNPNCPYNKKQSYLQLAKKGIKEIDLISALNESNHTQNAKSSLYDLMKNINKDMPDCKVYFPYDDSKLLLLKLKLDVIIKEVTYSVPILIYFSKDYPNEPPEFYIQKAYDELGVTKKYVNQLINPNNLKNSGSYSEKVISISGS